MKDGVNLNKPNGLNSSVLPAKEVISEKKDKQDTELSHNSWLNVPNHSTPSFPQ